MPKTRVKYNTKKKVEEIDQKKFKKSEKKEKEKRKIKDRETKINVRPRVKYNNKEVEETDQRNF